MGGVNFWGQGMKGGGKGAILSRTGKGSSA